MKTDRSVRSEALFGCHGRWVLAAPTDDASERLTVTAYDLFCRHGIRAVGVDRIVAEAGVAKATLYKHFPSKDDLVVAALDRRQQVWTEDWLGASVDRAGGSPAHRLMAIFDLLETWFASADYEGCLFTNTLLESHDPRGRVGQAAIAGMLGMRALPLRLAEEAAIEDAEAFAKRWHVIILGTIVLASEGAEDAAERAREIAAGVLGEAGL